MKPPGRSRVILLLVLAGLLAVADGLRAQQTLAQPSSALSGVVVDAGTRLPVSGAVVSLRRVSATAPAQLPRMVADARGRFVFADLPPADDYYLDATGSGYAPSENGWTAPGQSRSTDNVHRISLVKGQWRSDITIQMWRLGSITGRVVDERGEPVVGVVAEAFSVANISGQLQRVGGPIARTDDRGFYRLTDVPPGRYDVCVLSVQATMLASRPGPKQVTNGGLMELSGGPAATAGIDIDGRHRMVLTSFATPPPPASAERRVYPAVFYPNTTSASDAAPIDIAYGDSRSGIDLELRPVPAVRISGHLGFDAGATAAPMLLLRLMPRGGETLGFGAEAATTIAEPDGTFTFLNVPSGTYTLLAQSSVTEFAAGSGNMRLPIAVGFSPDGAGMAQKASAPGLNFTTFHGPAAPSWGRVSVTVAAANIDDLVLPMHATSAIHGRLVFAEGVTPPPYVLLSVDPATGDPSLGDPMVKEPIETRSASASTGMPFTIEGLMAGTYLLTVNRPGFAALSVISAGRDIRDTGFDGSLSHDFNLVVVTLTDKFAAVSGGVSDDHGPAAAAVIAFPVDRERWTNYGWTPLRLMSVAAGSNGAYQLPRLVEGDYFLIAVDPALSSAWVDPAFLAAAAPHATRVSVKWDGKYTADLKLETVMVKK